MATAFYAGLRLGELRALRSDDLDLVGGMIRVRRAWDQKAGEIAPKSRAGVRDVPTPTVLRSYLAAHRLASRTDAGLVFGRTASDPFNPTTVTRAPATRGMQLS